MQSNEALLIKTLLARSCPSARLSRVQRVQNKMLWREYAHYRDESLVHTCAGGDVNEMLLFHGTAERAAEDVLAHQNGLDPRFSNGGFYGQGIYLAEDPSYPIGGRYAHRISGSGGSRVQLLIVKAALGSQQEMGQRISAETRAMRMPDVRVEGPPRLLYNSVRGGPHRPFVSGGGENGCDASFIHVVYESRQMYPAYVIEVEMEMGAEVVAAVRAMGVAAAVAALRAHASVSRVAFAACGRLASICAEEQNCQAAADAGAIEAIVAALQAHPQVAGVQQYGCCALGNVCAGDDAAGLAHKQRAADAGGIELAVAAMQAHPQHAGVQQDGCRAMAFVCFGSDAAARARQQRAADAGGIELVVAALQAHPQVADVQQECIWAMASVCAGSDAAALARKQRAADAGGIELAVAALQAHPQHAGVQQDSCQAMAFVCFGSDAAARAR
ncbi:hypothetical protein EMIHUDRAFT_218321 [Emiliania huxleyi CCMP1516]|uniref:Poly [ADP-ribose] polymerase n=2 Tax=Emiliania huxleyi TaxID=2903 RepID=A0A0D3I922_EMIH1|nr:hypothetical protein EMIHUDRAFT_218321 [Emiliania huxleyi CCMP1516]EOD07757.1 hypothetical protein EMIHUDRAFT_218321 [Emiliania huxleyi CCMP1516]|eukprot:XP_005760186.1 hypothetical protein EMIHUDRAFT_218321 [Emiliania huxleyi CCMP1516]